MTEAEKIARLAAAVVLVAAEAWTIVVGCFGVVLAIREAIWSPVLIVTVPLWLTAFQPQIIAALSGEK